MSPEQARGKAVDKRADVWAFGCVLYEMLTGKRAFEGEDVSDILATVLKTEPDWTALPADVPATVCVLVRRCLEKDRRRRIADISTAQFLLTEQAILAPEPASAVAVTRAAVVPRQPIWRRVATHALAWLGGGALVGSVVWLAMRPTPPRVTRTTITPSGAAALSVEGTRRDVAITPDGTRVVYVGSNGAPLFVRSMDRLEATALSGLGTPSHPVLYER